MTKTEIKKIQARHSFLTSEYAKATDSQVQSGLRIRVNELSAIASVLNIELEEPEETTTLIGRKIESYLEGNEYTIQSKFSFNTGRQYAADGQIIRVLITKEKIFFKDTTRDIEGEFENTLWPGESVKEHLMTIYDKDRYDRCSLKHTYELWADKFWADEEIFIGNR